MFYTQGNRLMKVTTPLGPNVLLLSGFQGYEAISELFRFELDLMASRFIPIPFEKILGQPITVEITLPNGADRCFSGIVSRFGQGTRDDTFTHFKAEVVPKFWLLTKRAQSRIFQRKTIPEVLEQVFDGLDVSLDLTGNYEPRDYCVQYRETDFAFASRLMEEEGISYSFQHTDEGHRMLVCDSSLQLPDVPGPSFVVFDDIDDGLRDDARISSWQKSQQVCSTEFLLWDHCFELPDQNLEAKQTISESVEAGTVTHKLCAGEEKLEVYDYPGAYAQRFDGVESGGGDRAADLTKIFEDNKRTVKLRMEEEAAQSIQINGESNCVQLAAGHKFTLVRHVDADGQYLLTRVEHIARLATEYRSGGEETHELEYENRFACIPQAVPYRPRRVTRKPTVAGVQTATVVGPEGQHIFVDKYGRVKVQFHWDRQGTRDADSSCWIRVAQFWAGPRWGAFFWPRIGHEVVVAFAEGDPDQPVVMGNVYNAANMPPLPLPDNKEAGGIKSCSVGEDSAEKFNSVIFHDHPGDEHVHVHSETHEAFTSEGSKFHRTPGPQIRMCGSLPLGLGGGGGGGGGGGEGPLEAFALLAMADPIPPEGDRGSGSGGGLFEWPAAIGSFAGAGFAKEYARLFPGDAKFVCGSQTNSTMLGDRTAHILAGADLRAVVDIEAMLTDAIMDGVGAGYTASRVMAALGGAGGSTAFICGPNSTLTYAGTTLSVARGPCYQLRSKGGALDPPGKAAKLLAVTAALAMIAGDLVALLLGKHEKGTTTEPPEWAMLLSTALPSRLVAVLVELEKKNAATQGAALKTKEGGELVKLAMTTFDAAKDLVGAAERRVKAVAEDALAAATDTTKIFDGDYSLTAKDITLTSIGQSPVEAEADVPGGPSDIHLRAEGGGGLANNGSVFVDATKQIALVCTCPAGGPYATFKREELQGSVEIANSLPGSIKIQQGLAAGSPMAPGSPQITLSNEPPSIKLEVGEVASLELSMTGVTARFGESSITMNLEGITLGVAPSKIQLTPLSVGISAADTSTTFTPAMVTTSSPAVAVQAKTGYELSAEMVQLQGSAVVNVVGGLICLN